METNTVTPLLKRMEAEGLVSRDKSSNDGRQTIVRLTQKGYSLREELSFIPDKVGSAVICETVTPDTVPELFKMLDDIILRLKA